MIRIGDFARMAGVSVATLRHYAEVGLLAPAVVAQESGYRFYEPCQLAALHRIQALQSLGFTLREIHGVVGGSAGSEGMSALLEEKKRLAEERLQIERQKVKRLELQIQIIRGLQQMTINDVTTLTVPETTVGAVHLFLPTNDQAASLIGEAFDQLFAALSRHNITPLGPCMTVWQSSPDEVVGETLEVMVPVEAADLNEDGISVKRLPKQFVASATHRGPFSEFQVCHIILKEWMAHHGYGLSGPYREIYHSPPGEDAVTEVQYPVKPVLP